MSVGSGLRQSALGIYKSVGTLCGIQWLVVISKAIKRCLFAIVCIIEINMRFAAVDIRHLIIRLKHGARRSCRLRISKSDGKLGNTHRTIIGG